MGVTIFRRTVSVASGPTRGLHAQEHTCRKNASWLCLAPRARLRWPVSAPAETANDVARRMWCLANVHMAVSTPMRSTHVAAATTCAKDLRSRGSPQCQRTRRIPGSTCLRARSHAEIATGADSALAPAASCSARRRNRRRPPPAHERGEAHRGWSGRRDQTCGKPKEHARGRVRAFHVCCVHRR